MKVYVAGPMTNYPQFNIPAFVAAAELLRTTEIEVVSPVERDSPAVREAALASPDGKLGPGDSIAGETWGQILARDVTIVADEVDAVVVLEGWEKSKGARLEVFTALLCKKPVYTLERVRYNTEPPTIGPMLVPLTDAHVVFDIARSFFD